MIVPLKWHNSGVQLWILIILTSLSLLKQLIECTCFRWNLMTVWCGFNQCDVSVCLIEFQSISTHYSLNVYKEFRNIHLFCFHSLLLIQSVYSHVHKCHACLAAHELTIVMSFINWLIWWSETECVLSKCKYGIDCTKCYTILDKFDPVCSYLFVLNWLIFACPISIRSHIAQIAHAAQLLCLACST